MSQPGVVPWEPPSPQVRELIRQGAQVVLNVPTDWLDEMDRATVGASPVLADDPLLAAAVSRSNRANLFAWAAANVRDPGAPVPANLAVEPLGIARDLVRRGLDALALDAYRMGQNAAWRRWMDIAFSLTADAEELRELLQVSSQSISSFVDSTLAAIAAQIEDEREELTRGTHAERREVVALILDGAPISRQRAEARLGYPLNQDHTAAIVWTDEPESDLRHLDRAAEAFAVAAAGAASRPLTVIASAATRWVWVAGGATLDVDRLARAVDDDVRIAIGPTGKGMEGFRRSHLDALTTHRMLARLHSGQRLAFFTDVELIALITQDPGRADEFIKHTLGEFELADSELQATVLAFVNEQCNASRAAARLFTHRNTLLRRLDRAEKLLPAPLGQNSVRVAVALEALRWRGNPA